jgi:hypothetical protein
MADEQYDPDDVAGIIIIISTVVDYDYDFTCLWL